MLVGESCNRTVIVAERDLSVSAAARRMREYHVGSIVVVERNGKAPHPVGLVTDRDLVIEILAQSVPPDNITLGDVMNDELVTAAETDDLLETLDRMRAEGVRRVPVVDASGCLVGILATDDVLELLVNALGHIPRLVRHEQQIEADRRP